MANKNTKVKMPVQEQEPKQKPSGWMGDPKWILLADGIVKGKRTYTISLDELKQKFVEFVDYYTNNPVVREQKKRQKASAKSGNEAQSDVVKKTAPMTEAAFCLWCGKSSAWISQTIRDLKAKEEVTESDADRLDFFEKVRSFLNAQVVEGALLGDYTPIVAMAIVGIKNKYDVTSDEKPMGAPVIEIVEDKGDND